MQESKVVLFPTDKLQPHPYNAQIYEDREDPDFLKSIAEGIRQPLIVDENSLYVVSGCRRLAAAKKLGIPQVPVIFRHYDNELELKLDLIESNRYRIKTHSERMREADALEAIIRQRAKERQGQRTDLFPDASKEPVHTLEELADLVGYGSRETFRKVRTVWEKAKQGNRLAKEQMQLLDKGEISPHMAYSIIKHDEIRTKPSVKYTRISGPPKWDKYKTEEAKKFVSFSGGKSSLATLLVCLEEWKDFEVIYADTTLSYPENNEYIEDICKELGVKLVVVKPEVDFWEEVKKKRFFPNRRHRWCANLLKFDPLKKYFSQFRSVITAIGCKRADSSVRRKTYTESLAWDGYLEKWNYLPLLNWTEEQVEQKIREAGLWENPCYEIYGHSGCYFCPFVTKARPYLALKERHPELYNKILEAEKIVKEHGGHSPLWRHDGPMWLEDIEKCSDLLEA